MNGAHAQINGLRFAALHLGAQRVGKRQAEAAVERRKPELVAFLHRSSRQDVHGRLADEAGHELVDRMVVNLVEGAHLLQHAEVHHGDALRHGDRLELVVGDEDGGATGLGVKAFQLDAHVGAQGGVEVRERLVHQKDVGVAHQRAGERDALLLPAAQLGRFAVEDVGDVEHLRHATHALRNFMLGHRTGAQTEGDVVEDRERRIERIGLEGERHVALIRLQAVDQPAADVHLAACDVLQAYDHAQRRRLAAAGRPKQRQKFAVFHRQVEVFHGFNAAFVGFIDVFET